MSIDSNYILNNPDQLASQFNFIILGIPGSSLGNDEISLRMDGSFDPPTEEVGTIDIYFRGVKIPKTNTLETTTKEFTVVVRVDQNWEVYKALKKWKNRVYNPNTTTGSVLSSDIKTNVLVQALDRQGKVVQTFAFIDTKIKSIKVESFDHGSDDPSKLTLGFIYRKMYDNVD